MTVNSEHLPNPRIACVGAVVRDDDGRLLLIRRANNPGRGEWSIPGGRVESGETNEVALAREVREETGLVVTVGAIVGTVERAGLDGSTYVITDHICHLVSDPLPTVAGDDADSVAWVRDEDLTSYNLVVGLLDALRDWGLLSAAGATDSQRSSR